MVRTELRSLRCDKNVVRRWARSAFLNYLGLRRAASLLTSRGGSIPSAEHC